MIQEDQAAFEIDVDDDDDVYSRIAGGEVQFFCEWTTPRPVSSSEVKCQLSGW